MFRALLTMKFSSSPSESGFAALLWGSGSDAGLFLPVFLVGNVMATFRMLDLRPFLAGGQSTFWKKAQLAVTRSFNCDWLSFNTTNYFATGISSKTNHGLHLTVDLVLLRPTWRLLFWCGLEHLWFLCHPPPLSQAAPLQRRHSFQLQTVQAP